MSGALVHSPADIMRRLLIAKSQGTDPDDGLAWPIYATSEPDLPDNCLTVFNTQGRDGGRVKQTGERQEHYGFQVRVRSLRADAGFLKARAVAIALDQDVYDDALTLDLTGYLVHSLTRTSEVMDIGKDVPGSKRSVYTINAVATINQT